MLGRVGMVAALLSASAGAQQILPLPSNYKTIFENEDFLVMRVHYGAHETVPMHDHTAYPTVYVYLNDSGPVDIVHETPRDFTLTRPPTHTGAFRIAPGASERHRIVSHSDTDSDSLRIELKRFPPDDIKKPIRGDALKTRTPGFRIEFQDSALKIERLICAPAKPCHLAAESAPSLLVTIPTDSRKPSEHDVTFLPAKTKLDIRMPPTEGTAHILRIVLLRAEASY